MKSMPVWVFPRSLPHRSQDNRSTQTIDGRISPLAEGNRGQPPPFLNHGRIQTAIVDRVFEIAILKVRERRRHTIQTPFHSASHEQMRCRRAMIGSMTGILSYAAAEFGIGHHQYIVPSVLFLEGYLKSRQRLRQLV